MGPPPRPSCCARFVLAAVVHSHARIIRPRTRHLDSRSVALAVPPQAPSSGRGPQRNATGIRCQTPPPPKARRREGLLRPDVHRPRAHPCSTCRSTMARPQSVRTASAVPRPAGGRRPPAAQAPVVSGTGHAPLASRQGPDAGSSPASDAEDRLLGAAPEAPEVPMDEGETGKCCSGAGARPAPQAAASGPAAAFASSPGVEPRSPGEGAAPAGAAPAAAQAPVADPVPTPTPTSDATSPPATPPAPVPSPPLTATRSPATALPPPASPAASTSSPAHPPPSPHGPIPTPTPAVPPPAPGAPSTCHPLPPPDPAPAPPATAVHTRPPIASHIESRSRPLPTPAPPTHSRSLRCAAPRLRRRPRPPARPHPPPGPPARASHPGPAPVPPAVPLRSAPARRRPTCRRSSGSS